MSPSSSSALTPTRFHGNAIEYSQQRAVIVHGTHLATVSSMNVMSDVRGSGIFIEDGNEMFNLISHNVNLCPWARGGAGTRRGCSLPGTDNLNADSATNQARRRLGSGGRGGEER